MEEDIKESIPKQNEVSLELTLEISNDIKTLYANEVAVQTIHSEVVLSFFEIRLPLQIAKESENKAIGQCIGRIAMPLSRVPALIEALDSQFSTRLANITARKKSNGEINNDDGDSATE
ncbi:MAG: hypothetical protein ACR2MG_02900 [Pyrinomonadaceae bacterium]